MRENVAFANSGDEAVAEAIGQPLGSVVLIRPKHLQSKMEDSQECCYTLKLTNPS